jgi:hypothetical protein
MLEGNVLNGSGDTDEIVLYSPSKVFFIIERPKPILSYL